MNRSYTLRLTDTAEADLAEIWAYLAIEASEAVATRIVVGVQADYRCLLDFPQSGSPRGNLGAGLRAMVHGNYASYYRVDDADIIIVRVLHGARDAAALADRGGFG